MKLEEMRPYILDPNLIQAKSMSMLELGLEGEMDIPDPSNPFTFLIENTALITSAAMQETSNVIRKQYPTLANTKADLYHHITGDELENIFSTPSRVSFNIFINVNDVRSFGYRKNNYVEILLPKYSNIETADTFFTILNDITIRVYDNDKNYALVIPSPDTMAIHEEIYLDTTMIRDENGLKWMIITLEVSQLKRFYFKDTIIESRPYNKHINVEDKYVHLTAKSISGYSNNKINLDITYSNFVYNPDKPSLIVRPNDTNINIELPAVYIINGLVKTYVEIELFTTKGDIDLNLNTFKIEDFSFHLEIPNSNDPRIIGINNINFHINANSNTYGGKNEIDFITLKNMIINHSTGDNNLPITIEEIESKIKEYGFELINKNDTLFKREFLISKSNNVNDLYSINSKIDIFHSNVRIDFFNVNSDRIKITDDYFIINPFQRFKLINEQLIPLTNKEMKELNTLAQNNLLEYNKDKYFFNLYKYIIDFKDKYNIRVYDVNNPTINNTYTKFNNTNLDENIIIKNRIISNLGTMYNIKFVLEPNAGLFKLSMDNIYLQLKVPIEDDNFMYYKAKLINTGRELYFDINIPNDYYINNKDEILLNSKEGKIKTGLAKIINTLSIIIYSNKDVLDDGHEYLLDIVTDSKPKSILYVETFKASLGEKLKNIYTNYKFDYNKRKFKKYDKDIYLTHKDTVYETDEDGLPKIVKDEDGNEDLVVKYEKGSIVTDSDNNPIIKHKKGDIILDEYGKPIVDNILGVTHSIVLLLMNDNFLRATNIDYINYRRDFFINLTKIINVEISEINKLLLDNTYLKFIPKHNLEKVTITTGDRYVTLDNFISPTVNIYLNKDIDLVISDAIKNNIYDIISNSLSANTNVTTIEYKIQDLLGDDISAVKLTNITNNGEFNIINYTPESSRLVIDKKLIRSDNNNIIVDNDIKINIIKI